MPRLVRTPDEVFRETGRDLYLIHLRGGGFGCDENCVPGRADLLQWFKENLPNVELEPLGPSEKSGIVVGGCDEFLRVGFDPQSLAHYVATWENEDGSSKDPRWTCCLLSFADWKKQQASN